MRRGLRRHLVHSGGKSHSGEKSGDPTREGCLPRALTKNRGKPGVPAVGLALRLVGLFAVLLVASSCGLAGQKKAGDTPTSGGTATYALPPNANIDYIFPFTPGQYFTVVNTDNLMYLLYR